MGVCNNVRFFALRMLRIVIDFTTSFICGLVYGKSKVLPPIRDELLLIPATTLAEKIRKKQVKSSEVVAAYISRIRDVQPIINAVVEDRFEEALAEARKVDELIASGAKSEVELKKTTPLLGVPISVKEHIGVKGMHCTSGVVALKDLIADDDAEVVKLLRNSGAIPIATTNVPELCMWWESSNNIYGVTRNPYDTRRTCGGSTGGEGALIASAGSLIGVGSDIAGSIRLPSFMNGIFGHKSSSGVVSGAGMNTLLPDSVRKYASIGPMSRYAVDLLPLMKIMTKNDPKLKLDAKVDLRQLKIFYAEDIGDCPLSSPVKPAVQKALKMALNHFQDMFGVRPVRVQLRGLGKSFHYWNHVITEANPPEFTEALALCKGEINILVEFVKWCFGLSDHTVHALFNAAVEKLTTQRGPKVHQKALKEFADLRSKFNEILGENCVFLYPTQPEPAPFRHETMSKFWNLGYTALFNILLYPVTHVPMLLSEGLPVGIQCAANANNDRLTIAVAVELERAFGGWTSPCPVL